MKYTIELNGKGSESFIYKLSDDQYEQFQEAGIEEDEMLYEDICEVLGVSDYTEVEDTVTGLYIGKSQGEHIMILVKDESGNVVWESDEDFEFSESEFRYLYNDANYLIIEDYQKGNFFNYELELDEEFNPELLGCEITELLDGRSELITNLKYNFELLEKEYGDTTSKGFTYILS